MSIAPLDKRQGPLQLVMFRWVEIIALNSYSLFTVLREKLAYKVLYKETLTPVHVHGSERGQTHKINVLHVQIRQLVLGKVWLCTILIQTLTMKFALVMSPT